MGIVNSDAAHRVKAVKSVNGAYKPAGSEGGENVTTKRPGVDTSVETVKLSCGMCVWGGYW